jgi:putative ABC transport system permease protein
VEQAYTSPRGSADWRAAVKGRATASGVELPGSTVDELAAHLEEIWVAARAGGATAEEARARALQALEASGLQPLLEHSRTSARHPPRRETSATMPPAQAGRTPGPALAAALRAAFRQFRLYPTFALVTILVLGLGTGAAVTVFSIVDSVVLAPLPYKAAGRLVTIWDTNAGQALSHDPISPVNFMDQRALPVFSDAAAWWRPGVNLTDEGLDPVRVKTIETSANLFEVLGVAPQVGPGFPAGGPLFVTNDLAAVISDRLWRSRYNADPSIIGRQLRFNDTPYTIVGVMPPRFHFPDDVDVWERLRWDLTQHSRQAHFMEAVARLSGTATVGQAQAAVDALWTHLESEFGRTPDSPGKGWGSRLVPLLDEQLGYYRPALMVLFGATTLLFLIGVMNVASLQLTRAISRGREMAIRMALGASVRQVTVQLAVEGLVLSVAGAALGVAASAAGLSSIASLTLVNIPRLDQASVNVHALGLAVTIAIGTTLVFAIVPTFVLGRRPVATDLKPGERGSSRGATRAYAVLVSAEVALACALLVSSVLLVRTVRQITGTPLGVRADEVVTTTIQLTRSSGPAGASVRDQWLSVAATHAAIIDAIRQQAGVVSVGETNFLPLEIGWRGPFVVDGQPIPTRLDDAPQAQLHSVSDGYFETMGSQVAAGRAFTPFDGPDAAAVVVVNETFARRHLGGTAGVGRAVRLFATGIGPLGVNLKAVAASHHEGLAFDVVGVVRDVRNVPLGQTVEPAIYTSTRQFPFTETFLVVRAADAATALTAVRQGLRAAAPQVPIAAVQTWGDRFATRTAEPRLLMVVLGFFAALAAVLAALGVYGLFSWAVALRRRELAIRLTLGARPTGVGGLVIRQAAVLVATGLAGGLAVVWVARGVLAGVLYNVSPGDATSTLAAAVLIVVAALAACVPPVVRAMRVDPVEGLRAE